MVQEGLCMKKESNLKYSSSTTRNSTTNKKLSPYLKNCLETLNELFKEKQAEPFFDKIDEKKWDLKDFHKTIKKKPIDLNIIRKNFKKLHYKGPEHFKKHIEFMVSCICDHYPENKLCKNAKFVESFVNERMSSFRKKRMELFNKNISVENAPQIMKTDIASNDNVKEFSVLKEEHNISTLIKTEPVEVYQCAHVNKNMLKSELKKPSIIKKLDPDMHVEKNTNICKKSMNFGKIPLVSSGIIKKSKQQKRLDNLSSGNWNKTKKRDLQRSLHSLSTPKRLKALQYLASIDNKYCEINHNDKNHVILNLDIVPDKLLLNFYDHVKCIISKMNKSS